MRPANFYHILSLIMACLGTAAWRQAADFDVDAYFYAAVALLLIAAAFAVFSMRSARRERSALVVHLRSAAAAIRPDDIRFQAPAIDADSFGAAVDGLIAASRAQTLSQSARIRDLEVQLKAAALERDHAQSAVAEIAGAVKQLGDSTKTPVTGRESAAGRDSAIQWEVTQLKRDFVTMVSHEFRTPLSSIKAYTEMLLDGEAVDARSLREFYAIIHAESCRLGQSIDNVLNLTRLEAGLVTPAFSRASLGEVVGEAVETIRPLAAAKRLHVEVELSAGPDNVRADRDMLSQAVVNLVGNAVKYSPEDGRVTIRTARDISRGKLLLRVEDSGAGIAAKDLPVLLDRSDGSAPVEHAGRQGGQGCGVGLVLTRHVIEAVHGGRLTVESSPGRGSCFGFELTPAEEPMSVEVSQEARAAQSSGR